MMPFYAARLGDGEGLVHPLQGWIKAVTLGEDHAGFNAALFAAPQSPQTLSLVWRSGLTHGLRPGSELRQLVSHDEGASFHGARTIFRDAEWDTRNFASGTMGGGRIGIVATRARGFGADLEYHAPVFLWSDDGGERWSSRTVAAPEDGHSINFHGDIVAWPSAAGGDDGGGFVAFSYNFKTRTIDLLHTIDNGENWRWKRDAAHSSDAVAPWLTEMWVQPVAPEGPWLMIARPIAVGTRQNAALLISHDLMHWEGPHDAGVLLSGNAPALIIENGDAFLYTVSRRAHHRELPDSDGVFLGNRLMCARAPVRALLDHSGTFADFGGWREVQALPDQAVGYIFPRRIRGRWMAAFNCAETGPVGTNEMKRSWLCLMTPHPPLLADAPLLQRAAVLDNLLDNGDFAIWARGTLFDNPAPDTILADRWSTSHPADDHVRAERVVQAHPLDGPSTWLHKACDRPSGPHRTIQSIADPGRGAGGRVALSFRAASPIEGAVLASVALRVDYGRGGEAPFETVLARDVPLTAEPLAMSFTGALPSIHDRPLERGACVQIVFEESDGEAGHAYDVLYGDIALTASPVVCAVRRLRREEAADACARYYRRLRLWGACVRDGERRIATLDARFPDMAFAPVLRVAPGQEASPLHLSRRSLCLLARPELDRPYTTLDVSLDAEAGLALARAGAWPAEGEGGFARLSGSPDGAGWVALDPESEV